MVVLVAAGALVAAPAAAETDAMSSAGTERHVEGWGWLRSPRAVDLGVPAPISTASHISARGVVIGEAFGDDHIYRGFRWEAGTAVLLPDEGFGSTAVDVNVHGQVAGTITTGDGLRRTVLWEPDGTVVDIAGPPEMVTPWDIDDNGRVAVNWHDPATGMPRAAVWEDGELTLLGDLGGGTSQVASRDALNVRGEVTGTAVTADGRNRVYVWRDGVMTALPAPETAWAYASGITARGDVVGHVTDLAAGGRSGPALWRRGGMTFFRDRVDVVDVNDRGGVAGGAPVLDDGRELGYVGDHRGGLRLPTLGGRTSRANALNNVEVTVGWAERRGDPAIHPVAWVRGAPVPLGEQLPGAAVRGGMANDVNDRGQVVGNVHPVTGPGPSDYTPRAVLWELAPRS